MSKHRGVPTEQEVRRMFQESYYVTAAYCHETASVQPSNDWYNLVYPMYKETSDEP